MSDDRWRRGDRGDDPERSEFGGPLFPDDPADDTGGAGRSSYADDPMSTAERRLRFGPDDTGPLPHWTDPPTGEIPRLTPRSGPAGDESDDGLDDVDVDVWSTFTTESPVWRDDDENLPTGVIEQVPSDYDPASGPPSGSVPRHRDPSGSSPRPGLFDRDVDPTGSYDRDPSGSIDRSGGYDRDPSGQYPRTGGLFDDTGSTRRPGRDPSGAVPRTRAERGSLTGEVPRTPGRITIGTDPSGTPRRNPDPRRRPNQARGGRPVGPARTSAPPSERNMSNAAIAGLVIAAVFVASLMIKPVVTVAIVAVILAVAGWEYFGKVTEKGYRPAVAPGLATCFLAPIAAYAWGERALGLVLVLAFITSAVGFIAARGVESGPLPNMAVTTMGVVWIGILGAYAGLILRFTTGGVVVDNMLFGGVKTGTDTLFMIALGVAANDIGALLVGSAVGKSPLRAWVSPSKTIEGLIGGTLTTFFALFIASRLADDLNPWHQTKWILLLALVISLLAPLGDLTESMFKRNLEIKDFGTIIQGHGGVLDRFDGFLFVLPGAYYLTLVLIGTS